MLSLCIHRIAIGTLVAAAVVAALAGCAGSASPTAADTGTAIEEALIRSAHVGIESSPTCAALKRRIRLLADAIVPLSEERQRAELEQAAETAARILPDCDAMLDNLDNPSAVTTQTVDLAQMDIASIRDSVMNGYCDPASGACYDSFADQAGTGVTVNDFSCVSAGDRKYECIIQADDSNGDFTASITASCDDTVCIWRTQ